MVRRARRLIADLVISLWGVSTLVFFALRLSGDPISLLISDNATPEAIAQLRAAYGFDAPLWLQYVRFLRSALFGDFGESLRLHRPALQIVLETLPVTIQLTVIALALAIAITLPLGIYAALHRASLADRLIMALSAFAQAIPWFWLAIILILIFAVHLQWLPSVEWGSWKHAVLPAVNLAIYIAGKNTRLVRASLLEVLGQNYIRTARSKGLSERAILVRHALRNAAIPVITIFGLDFGVLLGGAVVTESIFAVPGVGRLVVQAIYNRDYPLVQAAVVYLGFIFILINTALDMVYTWIDPRIRVH